MCFGLDLFPEPQWLTSSQDKETEIRKVNIISQQDWAWTEMCYLTPSPFPAVLASASTLSVQCSWVNWMILGVKSKFVYKSALDF